MRLTPRGKCVFLPGALSSCDDGVRSSQEDGVDCGGVCTASCDAGDDSSSSSSALSQYRVVILASTSGIGFVVLGVAAFMMYRMHKRSTPSHSERSVIKRRDEQVKPKAVHVRPWAHASGAYGPERGWKSPTIESPPKMAAPGSSRRSFEIPRHTIDAGHENVGSPAAARGTRRMVAGGRTRAAVNSSVRPDPNPLVLF
jgi:hypothetical protein